MRTERQRWRKSRAWPEGEVKYPHPRVHTGTYTQQLGSWGNSLSADQELTGEQQTYLTLSTLGQDETPRHAQKGAEVTEMMSPRQEQLLLSAMRTV